jgi:hypothetical protein
MLYLSPVLYSAMLILPLSVTSYSHSRVAWQHMVGPAALFSFSFHRLPQPLFLLILFLSSQRGGDPAVMKLQAGQAHATLPSLAAVCSDGGEEPRCADLRLRAAGAMATFPRGAVVSDENKLRPWRQRRRARPRGKGRLIFSFSFQFFLSKIFLLNFFVNIFKKLCSLFWSIKNFLFKLFLKFVQKIFFRNLFSDFSFSQTFCYDFLFNFF